MPMVEIKIRSGEERRLICKLVASQWKCVGGGQGGRELWQTWIKWKTRETHSFTQNTGPLYCNLTHPLLYEIKYYSRQIREKIFVKLSRHVLLICSSYYSSRIFSRSSCPCFIWIVVITQLTF